MATAPDEYRRYLRPLRAYALSEADLTQLTGIFDAGISKALSADNPDAERAAAAYALDFVERLSEALRRQGVKEQPLEQRRGLRSGDRAARPGQRPPAERRPRPGSPEPPASPASESPNGQITLALRSVCPLWPFC